MKTLEVNKLKTPLELLSQFLENTPISQLEALVDKYENLDLPGPTYVEYMYELQSQLEFVSICDYIEINDYEELSPTYYLKSKPATFFSPPPFPDRKHSKNYKKRPQHNAGSFFFVILYYDRRKISRFSIHKISNPNIFV